jgi:hypothetical protein
MKKIFFVLLFTNFFAFGQDTTTTTKRQRKVIDTQSGVDYASPFVSLVLPYTYRGVIPYIGTDKKLSDFYMIKAF